MTDPARPGRRPRSRTAAAAASPDRTPTGPGTARGEAEPAAPARPGTPPAVALDTAVPALVLRLDHNPLHHGTLGVIRSLGRAGVPVHAVLEGRAAPAAASRHLRRMYPWRPELLDPARLAAGLHRLAARIGGRPLLVPMDDAGAVFAAEHAAELAPDFRLPAGRPRLPARLADKQAVAELCREWDVPHPATRTPADPAELRAALAELGLPLIAKWARPWRLPPRSDLRSTQLVRTAADARQLLARRAEAGTPLLLQRLVEPSPGGDWFFHGYFDARGRCLFGATGRKDRSWPPHAGLTCLGRWLPNPAVTRQAVRLASGVGHHGAVDLDFRRDPRTGAYHLLDFNPRMGAQFRLFADASGLDVVRAMHLDLTGRPVPAARPRHGRAFWVENYEPMSALRLLREGGLTARQWRRQLHGVDEAAWFAADDPVPFALMARRMAARGVHKAAARARPRRRTGREPDRPRSPHAPPPPRPESRDSHEGTPR